MYFENILISFTNGTPKLFLAVACKRGKSKPYMFSFPELLSNLTGLPSLSGDCLFPDCVEDNSGGYTRAFQTGKYGRSVFCHAVVEDEIGTAFWFEMFVLNHI